MFVILRCGLVDQFVESCDELFVSFGFGDPASLFGVAGECVCVNALGGKDRQVGGGIVEASLPDGSGAWVRFDDGRGRLLLMQEDGYSLCSKNQAK
ncbi:hypothetical protein [Paenarthrobacter aromaticivorans]|uniref:hypothetical protein n=1 Tax=Paenarthrobacter TaxID=1742992 RepID=UPI003A7F981B